jgi:hypothetical protein
MAVCQYAVAIVPVPDLRRTPPGRCALGGWHATTSFFVSSRCGMPPILYFCLVLRSLHAGTCMSPGTASSAALDIIDRIGHGMLSWTWHVILSLWAVLWTSPCQWGQRRLSYGPQLAAMQLGWLVSLSTALILDLTWQVSRTAGQPGTKHRCDSAVRLSFTAKRRSHFTCRFAKRLACKLP